MSLFLRDPATGQLVEHEVRRRKGTVWTVSSLSLNGDVPVVDPTPEQPLPSGTVVVDETYTGRPNDPSWIDSASNSDPRQEWWLEPGSDPLALLDGQLVKSSTQTFHRMWTKELVGGKGRAIRVDLVVASTVLPQTSTGSVPGLKVGLYFHNPSVIDKSNPDVRAFDPHAGSLQVFTGQSEGGYVEVSNNPWELPYRFSWQHGVPAKRLGYVNGTEQHLVITIEHLGGRRVRTRLWNNGGAGAPVYEWDDTDCPFGELPGFLRIRSDDTTYKVRWVKITDSLIGAPEPTTELPLIWQGDLTKPLPEALGFHTVDGSMVTSTLSRRDLGSIVTATSFREGRAFRTIAPANTGDDDDGYRALNELERLVPAAVPSRRVRMTEQFRVTELGTANTVPGKIGYGLCGAPPGKSLGGISSGGNKLPDSWSARRVFLPRDYLKWRSEYQAGHPFTFGAYLYAVSAGGRTLTNYGLEFLYRYADGSYFEPVVGRVYQQDTELVVNTPGQADGRYTVWIDGARVVNLTDVRWNGDGYDVGFSYLLVNTFANLNLTGRLVFDSGVPRIYQLP